MKIPDTVGAFSNVINKSTEDFFKLKFSPEIITNPLTENANFCYRDFENEYYFLLFFYVFLEFLISPYKSTCKIHKKQVKPAAENLSVFKKVKFWLLSQILCVEINFQKLTSFLDGYVTSVVTMWCSSMPVTKFRLRAPVTPIFSKCFTCSPAGQGRNHCQFTIWV